MDNATHVETKNDAVQCITSNRVDIDERSSLSTPSPPQKPHFVPDVTPFQEKRFHATLPAAHPKMKTQTGFSLMSMSLESNFTIKSHTCCLKHIQINIDLNKVLKTTE